MRLEPARNRPRDRTWPRRLDSVESGNGDTGASGTNLASLGGPRGHRRAAPSRADDANQPNKEDFKVLIPAFVTSQLRRRSNGALIFVPFIIVDMVVANILLAMGMQLQSPTVCPCPSSFCCSSWSTDGHDGARLVLSYT